MPPGPIARLEEALRRTRNADGGWGYYAGKSSRLEPTCWALMALREADPVVLRTWPAVDGLLLERHGGTPNYAFHGIALIAMLALGVEHRVGNAALLEGIQRVKGVALEPSAHNRQDNSLQAWSWIEGTFSWVEPTAWCLLAVKKWNGVSGVRIDTRRVREAEALLIDRCCDTGGWNHGNSNVFGKQLRAYVPTTAAGLFALQDRPGEPAFTRSLDYLTREADSERSGGALALALLALSTLRRPTEAVRGALLQQLPESAAFENAYTLALMHLALQPDAADVFRV